MEIMWADLLLKAERYPNLQSAKLLSSLFHPGLQNHRITRQLRMEELSGVHLVHPPPKTVASTVFKWILCMSKDEDSTNTGKPVSVLGNPQLKVFPEVQREPPMLQCVPILS